jgi:hypothetical protein
MTWYPTRCYVCGANGARSVMPKYRNEFKVFQKAKELGVSLRVPTSGYVHERCHRLVVAYLVHHHGIKEL